MSCSTHVLDAANGAPAVGLAVRLESLDGEVLTETTTDDDGRCPALTTGLPLTTGTYRLRFETGAWFARTGTPTFYPRVEIVFEITDADAHYHVPLLLSPFAYSTYRGS
jgi:5-hydroxyisourate hydrolase